MKRLLLIISVVGSFVLGGCSNAGEKVSEDAQFEIIKISGGYLLVDKITGCQYLKSTGYSSYTLRVNADGTPYCEDK